MAPEQNQEVHETSQTPNPYPVELEHEPADLHYKKAALVFGSAYIANDAALSTLRKLLTDLAIFSDAHNQASMIQGIKRGNGTTPIFQNNDTNHRAPCWKPKTQPHPSPSPSHRSTRWMETAHP